VILHCLAGDAGDPAHVTVLTVDTRPGDRWLMATDGLTDYVGEERVLALLGGGGGPEVVADALVDAALEADAWDNVSVVVADVVPAAATRAGEGTRLAGSAVDAADEVLDPTA
jgi:protein phosphatase